jgi:hypothetical protein
METLAVTTDLAGEVPTQTALELVFQLLGGPTGVLRALHAQGIDKIKTAWAVNKWLRQGRLPRTEYTGETEYAQALSRAVGGKVTAEALLALGRRSQGDT